MKSYLNGLFAILLLSSSFVAVDAVAGSPEPIKACDFRSDVRKLWEDHITWTRVFLISAAADLGDKDAATKRLLQNQKDIGGAVAAFYGVKAGEKLTALLTSHILLAAEVVSAAKNNEAQHLQTATNSWYQNADEIAVFLNKANPKNWPLSDLKKMMRDHLDLTTAEAVARLHGAWADDVVAYDKVHLEILQMADALSSGIMDQFPERFEP